MKTTVSFNGFTGVDAQVRKPSSSLRNKLFLASKPKVTHAPAFGFNEALQQAGKLVSNELASKFVVPSSACGNGGCPEHLQNALAARQANNLAFVEKQRALRPAATSPLRNEVRVTTVTPRDLRSLRSATYSARSPRGILAVLALQQEYSQLVPVKLRYVQNT